MRVEYNVFAEFYNYVNEQYPENFLRFVGKRVSGKEAVLDVGCGTGAISRFLQEKGCRVTGIDVSEEMIAIVGRKVKGKFYRKDLEKIGFKGEFDAAVSHDVMEHFLEEGRLLKCFEKVRDSLKKGGVFLFNTYTPRYVNAMIRENGFGGFVGEDAFVWEDRKEGDLYIIELSIFKKTSKDKFCRKKVEMVYRIYSLKKLKELLKKAGFAKVNVFGRRNGKAENSKEWFFYCKK